MSHKIVKIFDGQQNIFLCSIKGIGAQNIQTSHQGDLTKTRHAK